VREGLRDLYEQLDEAQDKGFGKTARLIEAEIERLELDEHDATFYDDHARFDSLSDEVAP